MTPPGPDARDAERPLSGGHGRRLVIQAQAFVGAVLGPGDWALDATVGNGRDTLFLAGCVGPLGRVYGFDIQPGALEIARQRLARAGQLAQTRLMLSDHALMAEQLPARCRESIKGMMMNLGYLPGGDRRIRTRTDSTLEALGAMRRLLAPGGRLSLLAYTGHPGGAEEAEAVRGWACALALRGYAVQPAAPLPGRRSPPLLICMEKAVADTCGAGKRPARADTVAG